MSELSYEMNKYSSVDQKLLFQNKISEEKTFFLRSVCVCDNCDGVHNGEVQGGQGSPGLSPRLWTQQESQDSDVTVAPAHSLLHSGRALQSRLQQHRLVSLNQSGACNLYLLMSFILKNLQNEKHTKFIK